MPWSHLKSYCDVCLKQTRKDATILGYYTFIKCAPMQKSHQQFTTVTSFIFCTGHHQTMRHFELKKNTIVLIQNAKRPHALYINVDNILKTL
jgi:hypothetical protein